MSCPPAGACARCAAAIDPLRAPARVIDGRIVAVCRACAGEREATAGDDPAERSRRARCECGATVELVHATTVVDARGVRLQCAACARGEVSTPLPAMVEASPRWGARRHLCWTVPAAVAAAAGLVLALGFGGDAAPRHAAALASASVKPVVAARAMPAAPIRPSVAPPARAPASAPVHHATAIAAARPRATTEIVRRADDPAPAPVADTVSQANADDAAGGTHVVIRTEHGTIHVWAPPGYRASHASLVTYVHGYLTDVDGAWHEHHLAQQFLASGRNALFVVPSAPSGRDGDVRWRDFDGLLAEVRSHIELDWPSGASVVIGHSGGFRSIARWLNSDHIDHIILLDALYGQRDRFDAWLNEDPRHRLTIIAGADTAEGADDLARRHPDAVVRTVTRHDLSELTDDERDARFLYLRTRDDSHMWLVTGAEAIPELLCSTSIEPVPPRILGALAP